MSEVAPVNTLTIFFALALATGSVPVIAASSEAKPGAQQLSIAGLFGPSNYDECVLENMKGVSSDTAAMLVANSCRAKFEKKESVSQASKKGVCNGKELTVNLNETAAVQFPAINDFGSIKIVKLAWEKSGLGESPLVLRVYVQHSYAFDIQGFYLQGLDGENQDDASYWCSGLVGANAVGAAMCSNVQSSSKTFKIKSVLTPEVNVVNLYKKLKKC